MSEKTLEQLRDELQTKLDEVDIALGRYPDLSFEPTHVVATEGKEFKSKLSGKRMGTELYLGYIWYNGRKIKDKIEHYIEVDLPQDD